MELSPPTASGIFAPPAGDAVPRREISSDFQTFLRMLTTQMQNQDPLNPIQSSDYAVQLATFSGVEQQAKTNELLKALGQQVGAMGLAQVAGWVGMEAKAPVPASFTGSPITIYPTVPATADSATLIVTDSAGQEVSRQQIDPKQGAMDWAGVGPDGQPLPNGTYSFSVESRAAGKVIGTEPAQIYALVREARLVDGALVIVMDGGAEIPASRVSALREVSGTG